MTFPGNKAFLGRYCAPIIDVGPGLTTKILINNGQQVHSSMYTSVKPDELVKPDDIKAREEFDTAIREKLGLAASAEYFESDPEIVTPNIDRYEDDKKH